MTTTEKEPNVPQSEIAAVPLAPTREVRPILAFLANFFAFGLGYVYVGELSLALVAVLVVYSTMALAAWTRLLVSTPAAFWTCASIVFFAWGTTLVHPAISARRNRYRLSKRYNKWWFYLIWVLMIGTVSILLTRNRERIFGYATFRVASVAMSPTLEGGDFFTVDTWRYRAHAMERGEIVVFDRGDSSGVTYIKRIVGLPGDRVESRDSLVYVNDKPVTEPYLHPRDGFHVYGRSFGPLKLGPGEVFVLGDFRDNSLDSRRWGPIRVGYVHGRANFIWFSYSGGNVRWDRVGGDLRPH